VLSGPALHPVEASAGLPPGPAFALELGHPQQAAVSTEMASADPTVLQDQGPSSCFVGLAEESPLASR